MRSIALTITVLLFASCLAFFQGCDIIKPEDRIEWVQDTSGNDTVNAGEVDSVKVVYIGDYTGHTCGNCPRAAEKADELKGIYGDRLVVVAIHAGDFAKPKMPNYPADYRTPEGTAIDAYFGCSAAGLPLGLVDQKDFNGTTRLSHSQWSGKVSQQMNEPSTVAMGLQTTYNASTKEVEIQVDLRYLTDVTANENIIVQITEDSIVSPQTDYLLVPDLIPDYVHKHMLRASVTNSEWGEPVSLTAINEGDEFTRTWTYTLDDAWVPKHCNVVAIVMDNSTKEVRNVREVHLDVE